jgi:hypothetical protein
MSVRRHPQRCAPPRASTGRHIASGDAIGGKADVTRDRSHGPRIARQVAEVENMKVSMTLAVFLMTSVATSGGEQLKIAVSPAMSFAPANLNIRARVVPNAENRLLTVVAESGEFYRSSQVQLEGEQTPAMITFEFRGVPDGDYLISGILVDGGGHARAFSQQHVRIIPTSR